MTTPTRKEVREWCEEALQICAAVDSMLVSTIYRTETSRWWAICNELAKLEFKLRVIHMKTRESEAWNAPLLHASRYVGCATQSAFDGYGDEYHPKEGDDVSKPAEVCKTDCKRYMKEIKTHIEGAIRRCS